MTPPSAYDAATSPYEWGGKTLVKKQVVRQRLEMILDHRPRHRPDRRRVPLGLLVLVDQQRPHALEEIMVRPHAGLRHAVLDGHRILERAVGAAFELLQRDRHRERRE